MKSIRTQLLFWSFILLIFSCKTSGLLQQQTAFPKPVDTSSKEIEVQEKKEYVIGDVKADNLFDGARLNGFEQINDSTYRATISPENFPINHSAYFGFRISSEEKKSIDLELSYTEHNHRYIPKLSYDRKTWWPMDTLDFDTLKAPNLATLRIDIGPEKLYVCGQELCTSEDVKAWSSALADKAYVTMSVVGKSKQGRDMICLDICNGPKKDKPAILVIGRQHPPEVSGHIAMEAFVDQLFTENRLSKDFLKTHRVLVYPLMNPDGVDMGHWRHSTGGIDLNRDWSLFNQEETRVVTEHMVKTTKEYNNEVLVGLDFHSTQKDLYYTLTDNRPSSVYPFKDYWLQGIDDHFEHYTPDDRPYDLSTPISKGWFYLQFGAEGITYEVGDETPRDFVRKKGATAANELMKLLILRGEDD